MPYFKDDHEMLFFLSDEDIGRGGLKLLPETCKPISDQDIDESQPLGASSDVGGKANIETLDHLRSLALQKMTPLLLSLQLGNATEEEKSQALLWQKFSRELDQVETHQSFPDQAVWPEEPI